ncbi:MAG: carboxymuconolactone decarboxylase family protein [Sneathiella sp.]|nr:carboxymuconolactone decarboxylase family protein [Sneathiella sp.]
MVTSNVVNYYKEIPEIVQAMSNVQQLIVASGFNSKIHHLVQLRASQINGCGFCVKMHTKEARDDGETSDRLDRVIVWRHVDDFSECEKIALEWTEALTMLVSNANYSELRGRLHKYFSDKEISILTTTISMINMWNRFQTSGH